MSGFCSEYMARRIDWLHFVSFVSAPAALSTAPFRQRDWRVSMARSPARVRRQAPCLRCDAHDVDLDYRLLLSETDPRGWRRFCRRSQRDRAEVVSSSLVQRVVGVLLRGCRLHFQARKNRLLAIVALLTVYRPPAAALVTGWKQGTGAAFKGERNAQVGVH